jgi:hypothetical protein
MTHMTKNEKEHPDISPLVYNYDAPLACFPGAPHGYGCRCAARFSACYALADVL